MNPSRDEEGFSQVLRGLKRSAIDAWDGLPDAIRAGILALVTVDYPGAFSVCCDVVSDSGSGSFARHSAALSGLPQAS